MCSLTSSWVYSAKLEALNITIGEIRFCCLLLCRAELCFSFFPIVGAEYLRRWRCRPLVLDSQIPVGIV